MTNTKIKIIGGKSLSGKVKVSGAKNAALPELAAITLGQGKFLLSNLPEVEDIKVMLKALTKIGADIQTTSDSVHISLPKIKSAFLEKEIVAYSRVSILLLGPLLARNGFAQVCLPSGCPIGDRKIDFHLAGLEKMGAKINCQDDFIIAKADRLRGIDYTFPAKSVTGTENLVMAASLADGTTVLRNCALEPEVGDLIDMLLGMGADIKGKERETLVIKGKTSLSSTDHTIIPDRIEMGTYVIAGAFQGNNLEIISPNHNYIRNLLEILTGIGIRLKTNNHSIKVKGSEKITPVEVETQPYPGFPTDLQAQLTTLLTQANGTSQIKENIFNNRFQHAQELNKMGANIDVQGNTSTIKGKTTLNGNIIRATDLRASAALVLGGIIARGETIIENAYQLFRGYEKLPQKLNQVGANITIMEA